MGFRKTHRRTKKRGGSATSSATPTSSELQVAIQDLLKAANKYSEAKAEADATETAASPTSSELQVAIQDLLKAANKYSEAKAEADATETAASPKTEDELRELIQSVALKNERETTFRATREGYNLISFLENTYGKEIIKEKKEDITTVLNEWWDTNNDNYLVMSGGRGEDSVRIYSPDAIVKIAKDFKLVKLSNGGGKKSSRRKTKRSGGRKSRRKKRNTRRKRHY